MGGSLSLAVRSAMRFTFQPYRLSCHAQRQPVPAATPPKSTVPMRRVVWPSRGAAVEVERARTRRRSWMERSMVETATGASAATGAARAR